MLISDKNFSIVTEVPQGRATAEQMSMLYNRYRWAADYCDGKVVLELACGAGIGLSLLARRARQVVAGDIDSGHCRMAEHACRSLTNVDIRQLDAESLPFAEGSFEVVILFEALYYLTDISSFLREARRVLRPGGTLLISTVNCRWRGFNRSPYSVRYLTAEELREAAESHGFAPRLWAGYMDNTDGLRQRLVCRIRTAAVRLHLIPSTMKRKEVLKGIFYGSLQKIPEQLQEGMCRVEPFLEIAGPFPEQKCKILYLEGRRL